jgi:hypothetical protein
MAPLANAARRLAVLGHAGTRPSGGVDRLGLTILPGTADIEFNFAVNGGRQMVSGRIRFVADRARFINAA